MTPRSLDRDIGRAAAAQSAELYGPLRRIGFLIMPYIYGGATAIRQTALRSIGRERMSEYLEKIKAARIELVNV
jgi:hypothetical protein